MCRDRVKARASWEVGRMGSWEIIIVKILEVDYVSQYIKIKPITSSSVSYSSKVVLSIPPVHEDSL